jgi:Uma2 family endonuclease
MALARIPDFMTVDEFLNWDSPEGYLWQLVDGEPVAMAPPVPLHGAIQGEIAGRIWTHLNASGGSCRLVITPGVIPRFQSDRNFMVPDLAVTCSSSDMTGKALHEPLLLIEILSPSNHAETWRNVWAYLTIPSLREILVVRTASMGVELLRRGDDDAWPRGPLSIAEGEFTLASIGLTVSVAALYRGTGMV